MDLAAATRPERDLLLVRREPSNESEWRGLVIPENARGSDQVLATVLAVGPGCAHEVGAVVVLDRGAGQTIGLIEDRDEELAIIGPIDVLAVLQPSSTNGDGP